MIDTFQRIERAQDYEDEDDSSELVFSEEEPADFELVEIETELAEDVEEKALRKIRLAQAITADDLHGVYFSQDDFALELLSAEQEIELGTLKETGREAIYYMIANLAEELDPLDPGHPIYVNAANSLAKSPSKRTSADNRYIEKAFLYLTKHHLHLLPEHLLTHFEVGQEARNELVRHNVRLAVSNTKRFGTELDHIQEANIGLIVAANKFDPKRGFRFSTYATWWIRQKIYRYMQTDNQFKVPVHVVELWRRVNKLLKVMQQERGRLEIPDYDLAVRMIEEKLVSPTHPDRVVDAIVEMRRGLGLVPSLDQPIESETGEDSELGDFVEDTDAFIPGTHEHLEQITLFEKIQTLPERLQTILRLRYVDGLTLEEAADLIPHAEKEDQTITRERVRQLEKEALKQLRQKVDPSNTYKSRKNYIQNRSYHTNGHRES